MMINLIEQALPAGRTATNMAFCLKRPTCVRSGRRPLPPLPGPPYTPSRGAVLLLRAKTLFAQATRWSATGADPLDHRTEKLGDSRRNGVVCRIGRKSTPSPPSGTATHSLASRIISMDSTPESLRQRAALRPATTRLPAHSAWLQAMPLGQRVCTGGTWLRRHYPASSLIRRSGWADFMKLRWRPFWRTFT
jgi:hypothetical protein